LASHAVRLAASLSRTGDPVPTSDPKCPLTALHEDRPISAALEDRLERRLFPIRASYNFYADGDFMGIHSDVPNCQVTLIGQVSGKTKKQFA
jgi:alkylated DNA repair dioxygenase AlkB